MIVVFLLVLVPLPILNSTLLVLSAKPVLTDVPRSDGDPRDIYSSIAGKHDLLGGKRRSGRDQTTMASGGVNNIAVIVGVAVSAASLLVVVVTVLLCRRQRRKRDDYALSVRCVLGGLGPTTVDDDLPNVVTSPGYKDRPLPDIVYQVRLTFC